MKITGCIAGKCPDYTCPECGAHWHGETRSPLRARAQNTDEAGLLSHRNPDGTGLIPSPDSGQTGAEAPASSASRAWTEEQTDAAISVVEVAMGSDDAEQIGRFSPMMHALCAEIAKHAHLFVDPWQPAPPAIGEYWRKHESWKRGDAGKPATPPPAPGGMPLHLCSACAKWSGAVEMRDAALSAIAARDAEIASLKSQLASVGADAERERMRLAACGVVGWGGAADGIAPEYESDSLKAVLSLRARLAAAERESVLRPRSEWHEDDGAVLWWHLPIQEPPYVGTPNDDEWPTIEYDDVQPTCDWCTHWTPMPNVAALRPGGAQEARPTLRVSAEELERACEAGWASRFGVKHDSWQIASKHDKASWREDITAAIRTLPGVTVAKSEPPQ